MEQTFHYPEEASVATPTPLCKMQHTPVGKLARTESIILKYGLGFFPFFPELDCNRNIWSCWGIFCLSWPLCNDWSFLEQFDACWTTRWPESCLSPHSLGYGEKRLQVLKSPVDWFFFTPWNAAPPLQEMDSHGTGIPLKTSANSRSECSSLIYEMKKLYHEETTVFHFKAGLPGSDLYLKSIG